MFAAVIGVLAQVAIPLPSGVPVTLQTFAVALTGVVLGAKLGTAATLVYVILGTVGVPVFTGFTGGPAVLFGKTGGFIWGFLFLACLAGLGTAVHHKVIGFLPGIAGLIICHVFGTLQFMILTGMGFWEAALLVSVPFLIKDICSVALAYILGLQVRKRLFKLSFLAGDEGKRVQEA